MTIKEQLTEKKQALVDLEPMLKSEDVSEETVAQGEALVKEIAELEEKCAKAEKAEELLKNIGKSETEKSTEEKEMTEMEILAQKCAEMTDKKSGVRTHFEKAYNSVITAPQIADVDRSIAPVGGRTPAGRSFRKGRPQCWKYSV